MKHIRSIDCSDKSQKVSKVDQALFKQEGCFLLKSFLQIEEVKYYRQTIDEILGLQAGSNHNTSASKVTSTMADGVTNNSKLWPLIFDQRLLKTIRELVGPDIRYTQHSDIHINLPGGRWHRDNAHRAFNHGADWQEHKEIYGVVRVAIYLSHFGTSGSSLLILPGSHRSETKWNRWEYVLWNKLRTFARKKNWNEYLPHIFLSRPYRRLKTRPGDCLIFDQRVMHAGGVLRGPLSKYALYMSFGLNNIHSTNHRNFFLERPTYSKNIPDKLREQLQTTDLLLPTPNQ